MYLPEFGDHELNELLQFDKHVNLLDYEPQPYRKMHNHTHVFEKITLFWINIHFVTVIKYCG